MRKGIAPKIRGRARLRLIREHRLMMHENAFDKYLRGEVTAEYVSVRAKKMLKIGLLKK